MFVDMSVYMHVHSLKMPKEGIGSSQAGVAESCAQADIDPGN